MIREDNNIPIPDRKPLNPELRAIAERQLNYFRKEGLKQSERFFINYLDGEGKPIHLKPKELDDSLIFRKAIETNKKRFEDSIVKGKVNNTDHEFKNKILNLKDGESKVLNNSNVSGGGDFWDRDIKFYEGELANDKDQARSIGSTKLRSYGSLKAIRKGNTIKIEGVVDNKIDDVYNFNNETIFDKTVLTNFKRMATEGNAKPFRVFGSKLEKVKGIIEIKDGKIQKSQFTWEDIAM